MTEKANGRVKKAFRRKKSLFATVELRTMAVESNFNFLLFDSNVVDSVLVVKMMRKIVSIVFSLTLNMLPTGVPVDCWTSPARNRFQMPLSLQKWVRDGSILKVFSEDGDTVNIANTYQMPYHQKTEQ